MTEIDYSHIDSALRQATLVLNQSNRRQALAGLQRWIIRTALPPVGSEGMYQSDFWPILDQVEAERMVEELIDTAFYLATVGTIHMEQRNTESVRALRVETRLDELLNQAGQMLEIVSACPLTSVQKLLPRFLLQAAVLYQVGRHAAKSWVMAKKLSEQMPDMQSGLSANPYDRYYHIVQRAISCFLMRDLAQARQLAETEVFAKKQRLASWINQALEAEIISIRDVSRYVAFYNLMVGILRFSDFLRTGHRSLAEDASRLLGEAELVLREAHLSSDLRLASMLRLSMLKAEQRSVWQQLGRVSGMPRAYLLHLVEAGARDTPIYELWESQIRAIQQGILDELPTCDSLEDQSPRHFVISMQPGAGKSLIAEMAIVRALSAPSSQLCIYITPARILVEQVLEDFRNRLRRLNLFPASAASAALSLADAMDIFDSQILISTPEKLSSLLARRCDESSHWSRLMAPERVRLIVVDEAHLLASRTARGILLEMLLLRLMHLYPHARVIFQSAVIRNSESISSWLNRGSAESSSSAITVDDWAPTDLVYAVLRRDGVVEYESGVEIEAIDHTDMRGATRPPVLLALKYCLPRRLTTLVFVSSQVRASQIATSIATDRHDVDHLPLSARLEELIIRVERELEALGANLLQPEFDEEFPLITCLRRRVAFHHAGLPSPIRNDIERAVRDGDIDIVVATTTLAEGVNLPVSCVVVADLYFFDPATQRRGPMPKMLVRNIAGRAGRPYQDTRGEVIIVQPQPRSSSDHQRTLTHAKGYWCRDNRDVEPIKSSLGQLCREVESSPARKLNGPLARVYQAQLLCALQEGAVEAGAPESFVAQTLLFHEGPRKKSIETLTKHTYAQIDYILTQGESRDLDALQRTGFSARACEELLQRVEDNTSADHQYYRLYGIGRNGQDEDSARSRDVLSMAFVPFEPHHLVDDEVGVLTDWVSGDSVGTLANRYFQKEDSTGYDSILSCQSYVESRLRMYAAWGLRGFVDLLRYWKERQNPSIEYTSVVELLPRYAGYGVNHPVAVYLQDLQALGREDALITSRAFDLTHSLSYDAREDFRRTRDWIEHPDRDALHQVVGQAEEADRIYSRLLMYSMPELEKGAMDLYMEGLTA